MMLKTKIFALAAIAFAAFSVPVFSQQISQAQLAGLLEDVAALRGEVARLQAELEDLRVENARLLQLAEKKVNPSDEIAPKIASLRAELKDFVAAQRREIETETDKKINALAELTNRALRDLSQSVNQANAAPVAPTKRPADCPDGGFEYTVKSGDTLSKIASKNQSKQSWILFANPGLDPNKIRVGQIIFVPQKD